MAPRKILNIASKTVEAIYKKYEGKREVGASDCLRCSELGHECERYLWLNLNNAARTKPFEGRMLRLFETGNLEENRVFSDLQSIGCEVIASQYEVSALNGKLKGHIDGIVKGLPECPEEFLLLEIKTHSQKSFDKLKIEGVEKSKPQHFAQMQLYMHLAEPQIQKALYFAVCKNTDEIYCEIVKHSESVVIKLIDKADRILNSEAMPPKCKDSFEYAPCAWCDYKTYCHQTWPNTWSDAVMPVSNERTAPGGVFHTSLAPFTPLDGDESSVTYLTLDGKRLKQSHGNFEEIK